MKNPRVVVLCISIVIAIIVEVFWVLPYSRVAEKSWDENMSTVVSLGRRAPKVPENTIYDNIKLWEHNKYPNVLQATIEDNSNGVVYYSLLHFVLNVTDVSFTSPRLLPNTMYFFSVLLFSLVAYMLLRNVGWTVFAVVLFSCHEQVLFWAATSRTYSTALLLVLASSYFLIKIIQEKTWDKRWLVGYAIFCALAFLTHYYTIIITIGGALALLITFGWDAKWKIIKLYLAIGVVPLMWVLYSIAGLKFMLEVSKDAADTVSSGWSEEITNPGNRMKYINNLYLTLVNEWPHWILVGKMKARYVYAFSFLPFLTLVGFIFFSYLKKRTLNQTVTVLLLLSCLPLFNIALSIYTNHNVSLLPKFSLMSVPYIVLLLVLACFALFTSSRMVYKALGLGLAGIFTVLYVSALFRSPEDIADAEKDRYIMAAEYITAQYQPSDTIVFPTWQDANITALYLPRDKTYRFIYDYSYRQSEAVYLKSAQGELREILKFKPDDIRRSWD